jgi:ATP-dependent helicase HrpA
VSKDLTWLERDLRSLARHRSLYAPLGTVEELQGFALTCARRHVLPAEPPKTINPESFALAAAEARSRLTGLAHQLDTQVGTILTLRQQLAARVGPAPAVASGPRSKPATLTGFSQLVLPGAKPATAKSTPSLASELAALVPKDFLESTPFTQLQHLPRYLKALQIRAERAANDPGKDAERVRQLTPYLEAWSQLSTSRPGSIQAARLRDEFRWMVEEFKVSLFAQELRTARPVSAKRLDELLERVLQAE